MENKVSVIVNFHNGVRYLEKCITSILEQNYKNLEIILWDNFSDDGSSNIVNKFKDSRIKYFYNKKKDPLYKARNDAVDVSKGEFIAFLDCDDWWYENFLSSRKIFFDTEKYDFSYSNCHQYFEIRFYLKPIYCLVPAEFHSPLPNLKFVLFHKPLPQSSNLFLKSLRLLDRQYQNLLQQLFFSLIQVFYLS